MVFIKTILVFLLVLLLSLVLGFGFWYLIFWFILSEKNLFIWSPVAKIFYLLFSFFATSGILSALTENLNDR